MKASDPPDFQLNGHEVLAAPSLRQPIRPENLDRWLGSTSPRMEEEENLRISLIAMSELRNINKEHTR